VHDSIPAQGDIVWIRQTRWRVERIRRFPHVLRVDVAMRDRRATFLAPFDRWQRVQSRLRFRRARRQRLRASLLNLASQCLSARWPASAVGAQIDLLPHQLEPWLAVESGARRVLIADDVGLGKTIQAGLVVAESVRRDPLARILVIAPAALAGQWRDELRARFRIDARLGDADTIVRLSRQAARSDNVWSRPGVWISSPDYLKQPHVIGALPLRPWDVVVVDEAHAVCGYTDRHRACDEIARRARWVVLMTATPHSGDESAFARLLDLGRLAGVDDAPVILRRTRTGLGMTISRRVRWRIVRRSAAERRALDALLQFERVALRTAGVRHEAPAVLLLSVFRKRALSTFHALATSVERRLRWLDSPERSRGADAFQPMLAFDDDADGETGEEAAALRSDIGLQAGHERSWLRRLHALAISACGHDTKIRHVAKLARRSHEPVVIFTEFRDSLDAVRCVLERAIPLAALHGGMSSEDQRRALGDFDSGRARVLVATDVASQGLNLQRRSRWVINLELPWNPSRIEQRIGRVDRIGQSRSVHATVLSSDHRSESRVIEHLTRRTIAARSAFDDGVFSAVMPEPARLRKSVLTETPLAHVEAPSAHVSLCRRWRRPAQAAAKTLAVSRQRGARWRARVGNASRTLWLRGGAAEQPAGARSLLVFEIAIADGTGALVERRSVVVGVPLARAEVVANRGLIEESRRRAARHFAPRIRRLGHLFATRRDRMIARERAIADVLTAAAQSAAQPGLFDGRGARAVQLASERTAEILAELERRIDQIADAATLDIGATTLVAILGDTL